jgi:voltage-gated potassium channel
MIFLTFAGAMGYKYIEGWTFFESLYMTVITLATVGFREVRDLSPPGQMFTIFLIVVGGSFAVYTAGAVVQFIIEGKIRSILGRKKLEKSIKKLKNHTLVCGYGRMGSIICNFFLAKNLPFVVIEQNEDFIHAMDSKKILNIQGDATDEEILEKAKLKEAKSLIAALGTDTQNVFLILTARQLNPDIFIIGRCSYESAKKKLYAAGADLVESPYEIGAARMAMRIERPYVTDFLDSALTVDNKNIEIEEIPVEEGCYLQDLSLKDSNIRQDYNLMVISIRKHTGETVFNPPFDSVIQAGDTLILIGEDIILDSFRQRVLPKSSLK